MSKIFVTGGTGLLGAHVLVELIKNAQSITAIYRNPAKIYTVRKCFEYYLKEEAATAFTKIKWVQCDILNIPRLNEIMQGHQEVYHCAGFVSFVKRDFSKLIEINRYGTANVVNAALTLGVKKFCHVSSTAAVGNKDIPENQLVDENGEWVLTAETSGYGISKFGAEKEVWRGIAEGLNAVIVNPSVIFGAGDWEESSMKIFNTIQHGLKFYSTGANAFVDARDVASIMVQLMEKNIFSERFLCIGENVSFQQLFEQIANELHTTAPSTKVTPFLMGLAWRLSSFWKFITFSTPIISKETARNAFNVIRFDNQKIRKQLDFSFTPLKETIKNAVEGKIESTESQI